MDRPLLINGKLLEARIEYVTRPDLGFLREWKRSLGRDTHPKRVDAVNFASLACKRYQAHAPLENYAGRPEDLRDYVRDNPNSEVASLVLMRCGGFPESKVIGLAHFRRSWCNNLILDYLSSHRWIAEPPPGYNIEVNGVGLGLMYLVCATAIENKCEAVWGEATQNSCEFYQKVFKVDSVRDLLYIPKENLAVFLSGQDQKWQERKQQYGR
jgi:hypothetical protein